ncbi:TTC28 [Symbiodinium sp. KB8]|nr:TTC28 [Symbiodinium sp. KB8]
MDVTTYITPPGFHLLDAAGTLLDGLAESFSSLADAQNISGSRRAAALLFSVAERALMTAKCTDDFLDAEHAAAESYLLFNVSGDFLSAAFSARLFVHALRAQAFALPCGRVGLEGGCREHFLDVATEFVDEEIARAELHGNDIPKMVLSLSRAEIMCDKKQSLAGALQAGEDIFSNDAKRLFRRRGEDTGLALTNVFLACVHLKRHEIHLGKSLGLEALRTFRALRSRHGECNALFLLAAAAQLQRKHFEVISLVKEALPLAQEEADHVMLQLLQQRLAPCFWNMDAGTAVREHAKNCRRVGALRPCLIVRDIMLETLREMMSEPDRAKAQIIADKTLTSLRTLCAAEWLGRELQLVSSLHLARKTRKQVESARDWAEQARRQLQILFDKYLEAECLPSLATCFIHLGDDSKAAEILKDRRRLFRDVGARSREAQAMLELAEVLTREQLVRVDSRARRFNRDAFQLANDAMTAFNDVGDEMGMASAHLALSDIYLSRQEPEEAEAEACRAEKMFRQAGEPKQVAKAVKKVGNSCCEQDKPEEAARNASEAVVFCKKAGDRYALTEMLGWEAQMQAQVVGKLVEGLQEKEAQKIVFRSLSKVMTPAKDGVLLARRLQDKAVIAKSLFVVAEVEASVGKWDQALAATAEAASLSERIGDKTTGAKALSLSSELHFRKKEPALARDEAEKAYKLAKDSVSSDAKRAAEKAGNPATGPGQAGPKKATAQEPWKPLVFKMPQRKPPRKLEPGDDGFTLKMRDRLKAINAKEGDEPDNLITVSTENAKNLALSAMWYIDQETDRKKFEKESPDAEVLKRRYDGVGLGEAEDRALLELPQEAPAPKKETPSSGPSAGGNLEIGRSIDELSRPRCLANAPAAPRAAHGTSQAREAAAEAEASAFMCYRVADYLADLQKRSLQRSKVEEDDREEDYEDTKALAPDVPLGPISSSSVEP